MKTDYTRENLIKQISQTGYNEEECGKIADHWEALYDDLCEGQHMFILNGKLGALRMLVNKEPEKEEAK